MTRNYLLQTVRNYRNQLRDLNFKLRASEADDLLQEVIDAGLHWQVWIPRVHTFVAQAERTLRRCNDTPA